MCESRSVSGSPGHWMTDHGLMALVSFIQAWLGGKICGFWNLCRDRLHKILHRRIRPEGTGSSGRRYCVPASIGFSIKMFIEDDFSCTDVEVSSVVGFSTSGKKIDILFMNRLFPFRWIKKCLNNDQVLFQIYSETCF